MIISIAPPIALSMVTILPSLPYSLLNSNYVTLFDIFCYSHLNSTPSSSSLNPPTSTSISTTSLPVTIYPLHVQSIALPSPDVSVNPLPPRHSMTTRSQNDIITPKRPFNYINLFLPLSPSLIHTNKHILVLNGHKL